MIALDTNVLVRHLAQDDAVQSAQASAFLEAELSAATPGYVSAVVLCELCWVMTDAYGLDRPELVALLDSIVAVESLAFEHRLALGRAIEAYRVSAVDFSDCLLREVAIDAGCADIVTFDGRFAKLDRVRLLG